MAIPSYEQVMLPFLRTIQDAQPHRHREVIEKLADEFKLSDNERRELLPSGQMAIFDNRVGWARIYLKKAGLVESIQRGICRITQRGLNILKAGSKEITAKYLEQFPEFIEFKTIKKSSDSETEKNEIITIEESEKTPEEILEFAYKTVKDNLIQELIERIKTCSPKFFESLVIDLLLKMGYGGSRKDAGKAIGRTGDGGLDGIIKEDKLGLDIIYVQAKRWEGQVPIKDIRDFAGSLLGKKAKRGIFITTSSFPQSAYNYVDDIEHKIILIDGHRLAELMIEYNVGVSTQSSYELKKIDSDYFSEE